jgi:DNA-binding winged helix-turn-helix (wHTH) protein/pSer/pThr/pTyr-binding forkhead associated (FHA) protein
VERLAFADCVIDSRARAAWRAGAPLHLQPKVMDLLLYLIAHRARFVSKHELQESLWKDVVVGHASLPRLVKELRRALGDRAQSPRYVRTLHGRGYQFVAELQVAPNASSAAPVIQSIACAGQEDRDATSPAELTRQDAERAALFLWRLHPDGGVRAALPLDAPLCIGRAAEHDVVLQDTQASRLHATITRMGPLFTLQDEHSRNGTFVDGERISHPKVLGEGQLIRIVDQLFVITALPPESAELPIEADPAEACWGPRWRTATLPVRRAASSTLPIELHGEVGAGKEHLARAVHMWSGREGSFCTVRCARLDELELLRELFGAGTSPGAWARAAAGTLFLDGLDEAPLAVQLELERALDAGARDPAGAAVRVIAGGQTSLRDAARDGSARPGLVSRLDGVALRLPPLRERLEDIPGLAAFFARMYAPGEPPVLSARFVEALCLYDWPFNVRELQMLMQKLLVVHGELRELTHQHLPMLTDAAAQSSERAAMLGALADGLREHEGNLRRASMASGLTYERARALIGQEADASGQ